MDVMEICNRRTGSTFSIEEMEFVVGNYIREKKGREVKVNALRDYGRGFSMFDRILIARDVELLNKAFNSASEYFLNK